MKIRKTTLMIAAVLSLAIMSSCGSSAKNETDSKESSSSPETSATTAAENETADSSEETASSEEPETDVLTGESAAEEQQAEPVKSDGYEKFSQIEIGMTEDEVNAILGEPDKVDKAYYYYTVTVNGHDAEVQVWINTTSGLVTYKNGDFYHEDYWAAFADSDTDFSTVNDLQDGVLDSYEECAAAFKSPGYLTCINEDGAASYLWVDSDYGHLSVNFKADGSVRSFTGYC